MIVILGTQADVDGMKIFDEDDQATKIAFQS